MAIVKAHKPMPLATVVAVGKSAGKICGKHLLANGVTREEVVSAAERAARAAAKRAVPKHSMRDGLKAARAAVARLQGQQSTGGDGADAHAGSSSQRHVKPRQGKMKRLDGQGTPHDSTDRGTASVTHTEEEAEEEEDYDNGTPEDPSESSNGNEAPEEGDTEATTTATTAFKGRRRILAVVQPSSPAVEEEEESDSDEVM